MDLKLSGKHALVTGGSYGIGFAIAEGLAQEGCRLTVASRSIDNLQRAQARLANASTLELDISDDGQIDKLAKWLVKNSVDILVVNSGGPPAGAVKALAIENWDAGYRLLIRSLIRMTGLVAPSMREKKWGRILSVNSTSAVQIIPTLPISGTFRAGLSAWVKHAAKEYGTDGILINNLLPGPTVTARLTHLMQKSPETVETMKRESALGRFAEPEEIARVAVFLCSGANTYVTGTDVLVDGGLTTAI